MFTQKSPIQHEYSLEYLSYLSKCCRRSRLYYQQSVPRKNNGGSRKWGKWINLVFIHPKTGRHNSSNVRSNATGVSVTVATDRVEESPNHESANNRIDCNHNLVGTIKELRLLPTTSTPSSSSVQKGPARFVDVDDLSDTNSAAAGDAFVDMPPSGCCKKVGKKQKAKAKNLRAKSKQGCGLPATRVKKEQIDVENKRPRNLRKAKNDANTQMKLQFANDPMPGKLDYEDVFNDDAYAFETGSSPEHRATKSYRDSKQHDKQKIAGGLPPLAERIMSSMSPGKMIKYPSSFTAVRYSSFRSSSERSSRLYDNMMQQECRAMPKEHSMQSHNVGGFDRRSFQLVEATTEKETVPRYV